MKERIKAYRWLIVGLGVLVVALAGAVQLGLVQGALGEDAALCLTCTGTAGTTTKVAAATATATPTRTPTPVPTPTPGMSPAGALNAPDPAIAVDPVRGASLFLRSNDRAVYERRKAIGSLAWGAWQSRQGSDVFPPAVSGMDHLVVRGDDSSYSYRHRGLDGNWSAPERVACCFNSAPALVVRDGSLWVFGRGYDNAMWYTTKPLGRQWAAVSSLGGVFTSPPAAIDQSYYTVAMLEGIPTAMPLFRLP